MAQTDAGIELEGVTLAPCLAGFHLRVPAGQRLALLGPNGAGKTTVLRLAAGLLDATTGQARATAPVGYVAQSFRASLLPWLTVERNLALPRHAQPPAAVRAALDEALGIVPLPRDRLPLYPYQLSGGEQQLACLARALVAAPRTLLLDEPLAAIDVTTRVLLRHRLRAWCDAHAATLVLVSHDVDDVLALAERVVVLQGRPVRVGADFPLDHDERRLRQALERASEERA